MIKKQLQQIANLKAYNYEMRTLGCCAISTSQKLMRFKKALLAVAGPRNPRDGRTRRRRQAKIQRRMAEARREGKKWGKSAHMVIMDSPLP